LAFMLYGLKATYCEYIHMRRQFDIYTSRVVGGTMNHMGYVKSIGL